MKDIMKFGIGLVIALTAWHYSDKAFDALTGSGSEE